MIRTKCILRQREASDGVRISVMSRHTLNDGKTPHPLITLNSYDVWIRSLGPPDSLVGAYYKRGLPWDEFEERYLAYLRDDKVKGTVERAARWGKEQDITLLCIEETPDRCHRRLLAEECKRYDPQLSIRIN